MSEGQLLSEDVARNEGDARPDQAGTAELVDTSFGHVAPLDGLRGLAVAAVVVFHGAQVNGLAGLARWTQGGFLGVSTFFTLSGFLITTLLLQEHVRTGGLSLIGFWSRRARRLLPASLLTLLAVVLLTPVLGSPEQFRSLPGEVWSALGYVTNWKFILADSDYADLFSGAPSPIKHFWSLAIEEQWYLLMPLLAALLLRRFRRGPRALTAVMAALALVSTAVMVIQGNGEYSNAVYLGTHTRLAELAVGAAGAGLIQRNRILRSEPRQRHLQWLGALMLLALVWTWSLTPIDAAWLYRGGFLAHSVGVMVVIWAACQPRGPLTATLGSGPLVNLGKISYGLYLFHWPMMWWMSPERLHLTPGWALLVQCGAAVGLATLSRFALEEPIRTRRWITSWRQVIAPVGAITVVALAAFVVPEPKATQVSALGSVRTVVFPTSVPQAPSPSEAIPTTQHTPANPAPSVAPPVVDATAALRPIPPASESGPLRVIVSGDSFAMSLVPGLQRYGERTGTMAVMTNAFVGCGVGRGGKNRGIGLERPWPKDCQGRDADLLRNIASFRPDVALIAGGMWDVTDRKIPSLGKWRTIGDPDYDQYLRDEILHLVDLFEGNGVQVVWTTAPHWEPQYTRRIYMGPPPYAEAKPERTDALNALFRATLVDRPNAALLPLAEQLQAAPGGEFNPDLRNDGVHLTEAGTDQVAQWLAPSILTLAGRS